MEIKYAENADIRVSPETVSSKINKPGKNYSGASVDGQFYGRMGAPLTGRALRRRHGQINRNNPLLQGLKAKTKTGASMRRPFSTHSSNPKVREFARALERFQNGPTETQA